MDVIIAAVLVAHQPHTHALFTCETGYGIITRAYKNEMLSERQKIEIIDEITANMPAYCEAPALL
tara:strand:+ start:8676 stop:8870 length:195 start_codon:yes stop_codon:yes gene_type:complete